MGTATKTITVVVAGTGERNDLPILPGTEVRDLLERTNLRDYQLSTGVNAKPLGERQLVYPLFEDGEVVYATPRRMEPAI